MLIFGKLLARGARLRIGGARPYRFQRYLLTLQGWCYIGVMLLVGIAAWHSGANLLYLLFAMLIAVFLIQGALVWLCLLGIEAERRLPAHITALHDTVVHVRVRNRKRLLSSYALRVVDHLSSGRPYASGFLLHARPAAITQTDCHAVFPHRGKFVVKKLELSTRYPFGLVRRSIVLLREQEVLVYPQVLELGLVRSSLQLDIGDSQKSVRGHGSDLYGVTEYREGEHIGRIHWRTSAKARKLMVIEREKDERKRVSILLHNALEVQPADEVAARYEFEKAIVFAASLANDLIADGYEIQLLTCSGQVRAGAGRVQLFRVLRALAALELRTAPSVLRLDSLQSGMIVNIIFEDGVPMQFGAAAGVRSVDVRHWEVRDGRLVSGQEL